MRSGRIEDLNVPPTQTASLKLDWAERMKTMNGY